MALNTLDPRQSMGLERAAAVLGAARPELYRALSFLVGLPLFFGFLIGWFRGGSAKHLPLPLALAFWISGFLILWWSMEASSRVVSWLSGRRLPLAATLLAGAALGIAVAHYPLTLRLEMFRPHFGGWMPNYAAPPKSGLPWLDWLRYVAPILLVWTTSNWVYFVPLAKRRFGLQVSSNGAFWFGQSVRATAAPPRPTGATSTAHVASVVLPTLLLEETGTLSSVGLSMRDVVALDADDHYTRVYLRGESRYLRAQFGHLLLQMPPSLGIQVSRSTWVAFDAIEKVMRSGRGLTVRLVNGESMQVTRGYKVAFERAYR